MIQINQQLLDDCHFITQMQNCTVLLHKNASLHWFILVPDTELVNLLDLDLESLNQVMAKAQIINHYLKNTLKYEKTNMGSIGNIVKQMHIHIIGRTPDDACWPQPVWGNLSDGHLYKASDLKKIKEDIEKL